MKKSVWIVLIAVFAVSTAGFIYTFVQPRYLATVIGVGRARSVTSHSKHGSRSHTVIPLIVSYTDADGEKQTVEASYPWPKEQPVPGQVMQIVRSFDGFTVYPFAGLRMFTGVVDVMLGLFFLAMWLEMKKPKRKNESEKTLDTGDGTDAGMTGRGGETGKK